MQFLDWRRDPTIPLVMEEIEEEFAVLLTTLQDRLTTNCWVACSHGILNLDLWTPQSALLQRTTRLAIPRGVTVTLQGEHWNIHYAVDESVGARPDAYVGLTTDDVDFAADIVARGLSQEPCNDPNEWPLKAETETQWLARPDSSALGLLSPEQQIARTLLLIEAVASSQMKLPVTPLAPWQLTADASRQRITQLVTGLLDWNHSSEIWRHVVRDIRRFYVLCEKRGVISESEFIYQIVDRLQYAITKVNLPSMSGIAHDILGNPFRESELDPRWLVWKSSAVVQIARRIYETECFQDFPILGDALEEAGCEDQHVLQHCRETRTHCRGCWLLHAVLAGCSS